MKSRMLAATIMSGICAYAQAQVPPAEPMDGQTVVFVCEHGSVKSLLAALLFERAAAAEGLEVRGVSRGAMPDTAVPEWMRLALEQDGFDIGKWRPGALSGEDIRSARRVVLFDVSLPPAMPASPAAEHWDGLPSVSKDYRSGRDAIAAKVDRLVGELKRDLAAQPGRLTASPAT